MSNDIEDVILLHIDGNGNQQAAILAANVITLVGAIATIILRFLSRRVSKTKFWWDDWLVIPALVFALVYFGNMCGSLTYGFGKYIGAVSFARLRQALIGVFVGELTYVYSLTFTKFSILALYSRLFDQRWARIYCYIMAFVNLGWIIASTILSCLQCQPTNGFWDRNIPEKCTLNVRATFLGLGIVTILSDLALVALPTYICWNLSLTRTKKLLVCGVFVTGLFVTIASGVRMRAITGLDTTSIPGSFNVTWNFSDTALWSGVEVNMAIVSSCLPVLRPLVAKAIPTALVPSSLRKRSQPASYYGLASNSTKKASTAAVIPMDERSPIEPADLEAQRVENDHHSARPDELCIEQADGPQELRTDKATRPPTRDKAPVMKATLTRPPSWNMDIAYAEGQSLRAEKGSSDSLRPTDSVPGS